MTKCTRCGKTPNAIIIRNGVCIGCLDKENKAIKALLVRTVQLLWKSEPDSIRTFKRKAWMEEKAEIERLVEGL